MAAFLGSIKAGLKDAALDHLVKYACTLSQFKDDGGPPNAKAMGEAQGLREGAIHEQLNEKKYPWSPIKVRHKLGIAALQRRIDGILLCHFFTEHAPGYTIIVAFAFAADYRMLIGARRAKRSAAGPEDEEALKDAYHSLVLEVSYLLSNLDPPEPVPVLAESPFVGQAAIANLVASDLDYLVELSPSWSAGGPVPVETLAATSRTMKAGTTLRGFFPLRSRAREVEVEACPVVLNTWSQNLGSWAVRFGSEVPAQRFFLARMSFPGQLAAGSGPMVEERVRHWAATDLDAEAWIGYGLERYHAPGDAAFDRHCTALTLRDAYLLDQRRKQP